MILSKKTRMRRIDSDGDQSTYPGHRVCVVDEIKGDGSGRDDPKLELMVKVELIPN